MELDLSNKVAFVAGASCAIGKGMVKELAGCGANVGMMDANIEDLTKIETTLNKNTGGNVFAIPGDASSPEDMETAMWQIKEVFGGIDMIILL